MQPTNFHIKHYLITSAQICVICVKLTCETTSVYEAQVNYTPDFYCFTNFLMTGLLVFETMVTK